MFKKFHKNSIKDLNIKYSILNLKNVWKFWIFYIGAIDLKRNS